jgi:hypothetical protein
MPATDSNVGVFSVTGQIVETQKRLTDSGDRLTQTLGLVDESLRQIHVRSEERVYLLGQVAHRSSNGGELWGCVDGIELILEELVDLFRGVLRSFARHIPPTIGGRR